MNSTLDQLRWKKFPVLNDGFVCLVDAMGDDSSITQAARVSYGNDKRDKKCPLCSSVLVQSDRGGMDNWCQSCNSTFKEVSSGGDDRHLIRYLMRHRHTTPFEMAEVKLLVRVPMDCWRQWIRHRTANVNEYSTRYTEAIDARQITDPESWRKQATGNKQGSEEGQLHWPKDPIRGYQNVEQYLSARETSLHIKTQEIYEERLAAGVAKEQARKDLPLSTYTEAYWKCDLHNIFHFLGLRMDGHAQAEIRAYANIIGELIIKPLFPLAWEAFEDYRLGGMFLSRLDQDVMQEAIHQQILETGTPREEVLDWIKHKSLQAPAEWLKDRSRERDEFLQKMVRMGLLQD